MKVLLHRLNSRNGREGREGSEAPAQTPITSPRAQRADRWPRPPTPPRAVLDWLLDSAPARAATPPSLPKQGSPFATIEDCPQEILDTILSYHCPVLQYTTQWTADRPIHELIDTLLWLRRLVYLNRRWFYAIRPLLQSVVIVAAGARRSRSQAAFAKRYSRTIRRVVLDCRHPWDNSEAHRTRTLSSFKECLDACTNLQILDVVCLNDIILPDTDAQRLTRSLFSHISSNQLRTLAIRTKSTEVLMTNVMTLHILDMMKWEVVRDLTDLEIQSWTGQTNSTTLETSFPSLKRLTLSRVSPRALDDLFEIVSVITKPSRKSTLLSDLSFSSTYIRLSTIERLLGINNIGETLLSFKCSISWIYPSDDLPVAPSAIFALCPHLQTLHLFAPCPTSIFANLPPSLIELGVLVMKDCRLPAISRMDAIILWSNDVLLRKNVKRLVMKWYLDDERKERDHRKLRRSHLGVEVLSVA
ncbi:hypothetical protein BDN72DRAFT_135193 [Pluteus cervinus]|uniref:Uncharacterized protein n=1 Tax=Pluteus cervinus TaxID=181527 RepID=A0ACD3B8D6_9AGAR|nr:hypothetical protein BDN72DRAFT_135193 [Pluteus cervinus]